MIRLGFGARLFIIFATSLVALQLLAVAVYLLQRSRATEGGLRLPLPGPARGRRPREPAFTTRRGQEQPDPTTFNSSQSWQPARR